MQKTLVFFGIVGSGKGTQVKLLKDFLQARDGKEVVFVSTGDQYRKILGSGTQSAILTKAILEKGALMPDFFTNGLFTTFLSDNLSLEKHLIADGYPRSLNQSDCLEQAMNFYGRENIKIVYLELSKEEAVKRMKLRNRHDDTDEAIAKRFDEYVNHVVPSMNYFKDKPGYEIFSINGEQSIENVFKDIKKALGYEK